MSIAALALDRYTDNTATVAGKESYFDVEETSKSFGAHLNELYRKLLNNETEVKIRIGSQEFSDKE